MPVSVCLGTSCHLRGSQQVLQGLLSHADEHGLESRVDVRGAFCFENCEAGPTVEVAGQRLSRCTVDQAREAIENALPGHPLPRVNGNGHGKPNVNPGCNCPNHEPATAQEASRR